MRTDIIESVGVDDRGSLWVKPSSASFPYIYREAMGVQWDEQRKCLFGSAPREFPDLDFSRPRWFRQIIDAAKEQGVELVITASTMWLNVEHDVQKKIVEGETL